MIQHRISWLPAILLACAAGSVLAQAGKTIDTLVEVPNQGVVAAGRLIPGASLNRPDQLDFCNTCKCCSTEKLSYDGFVGKYQPDAAATRALRRWDGDAEIRRIDLSPGKR